MGSEETAAGVPRKAGGCGVALIATLVVSVLAVVGGIVYWSSHTGAKRDVIDAYVLAARHGTPAPAGADADTIEATRLLATGKDLTVDNYETVYGTGCWWTSVDGAPRLTSRAVPPRYLAYQSSEHCATFFATEPITLKLPELIPNFDGLDAAIRALAPNVVPQPPSSIVRTDGLSLHRARAATSSGWRLWVRCVETDREVQLDSSIIECYGTVFRPTQSASG